jgi:hypothetical protein
MYATEEGKKAGVTLRHPRQGTICELGGQTLFEIIREGAAALRTRAELYTPGSSFIKCANEDLTAYVLRPQQQPLKIGGLTMMRNIICGVRIGVWVRSDGRVAVGIA